MADDNPMPRDFGWRYIGWLAWTNALTILGTLQLIFASLALMTDVFPHVVVQAYLVASAVLSIVVSQIKRNNPPGPPPLKTSATPLEPSHE